MKNQTVIDQYNTVCDFPCRVGNNVYLFVCARTFPLLCSFNSGKLLYSRNTKLRCQKLLFAYKLSTLCSTVQTKVLLPMYQYQVNKPCMTKCVVSMRQEVSMTDRKSVSLQSFLMGFPETTLALGKYLFYEKYSSLLGSKSF